MDAQAIYRKSEKGSEAIAARAHGVGGKLRMLLILVDGKKNIADLTKLAVGLGESAQLIDQMIKEGLIELASGEAGEVATMPVGLAAASDAKVAPAGDLVPAKTLAARLLIELLGPMADDLCLKIESAKDAPQFIDIMKRAYGVVREIKGKDAADRFGGEVEAKMPPT